MRAVWSFWTRPLLTGRRVAWYSRKHHWHSWVLSVELARRHFSETCLYTDDAGADLLVDKLGLTFTSVSTALNALDGEDLAWWALGKVLTYSLQAEPFVHIDDDVYLWQPLQERVLAAPVLAQSPEYFRIGASCYRPEVFDRAVAQTRDGWLPKEWLWYRSHGPGRKAECCGVFGGNNLPFIAHYARAALRLMQHPPNRRAFDRLADKLNYSILFEQYLLSACIDFHSAYVEGGFTTPRIAYVFEPADGPPSEPRARALGFTHVMGAKSRRGFAVRLEKRVRRDYPELYERCVRCQPAPAHLMHKSGSRSENMTKVINDAHFRPKTEACSAGAVLRISEASLDTSPTQP